MAITIKCTCGRQEEVPDSAIGVTVKCPDCSRLFIVRRPQGSRQRMYIFERAYVDYIARLRKAFSLLTDNSRKVCRWFWSGYGSVCMEYVLQAAVAISGIIFGILYVNYDRSVGGGFGFGTIFAFALIAGYVALLMWGWKAPVHVGARAASAAAAGGVLATAGMAVLAAGSALFSLYLIGLVTVTGLTVIVFGPIRLYLWIYMRVKKLTYDCPCDQCPPRGSALPIYLCACGHAYTDLQPSFYGIFHHRCHHDDGTHVDLPTLDMLGRSKLPQFCPTSGQPMVYGRVGLARRYPIVVVGPTRAGKTVFLTQAARELWTRINAGGDRMATLMPEEELKQKMDLLDSGQTPDATTGAVSSSVGVFVQRKDRRRKKMIIEIFDEPGEVYESIDRFAQKQVMQRAGGIILLIDPFSLPKLAGHATRAGLDAAQARTTMTATIDNLVHLVAMMRDRDADQKFSIPLSVVISKADELPTLEMSWLANLYTTNGEVVDEKALSDRCRNALSNLGIAQKILLIEQNFSNVRYFACSALGRRFVPGDRRPFKAAGVGKPFLWLLRDDAVLAGAGSHH